MNSQELRQKLAPAGGALTLTRDGLGAKLGDLLALHFGAATLVISQAALDEAAEDQPVVVRGRSSFAGVADLPIQARFTVDAAGEVQAELRYRLRDDAPGPAAWRFSTSFTDLPSTLDHATRERAVFLDALQLFDTSLVLVTSAGRDEGTGAPLATGAINLVGRLRPQGILGVFEHVASAVPHLPIHGIIRLPRPGEATAPLRPFEQPWDRLASQALPPPPGIHLEAALDVGFRAGKIALAESRLRIYSPISNAWMAENPGFAPIHGYTATLAVPSAGIEAHLGAVVPWGVRQALLSAQLEGVSIGDLAHLADFTGSADLVAELPEALRAPVAALGKLELTRLALDLVVDGGIPGVRALFATVGFPGLRWHAWKDDLVVEELSCCFSVLDPLRPAAGPSLFRSRLGVLVRGVLAIEGSRLAVTAGNDEGFVLRATTLEPVRLPLDKLVRTHGPGLPVPSALTVDYLDLAAAPGRSYEMDLRCAGDGAPWTLDVGHERLTVSDVSLHLERPAAGPATGRFAGAIDFAGAMLQVSWAVPGTFLVRGTLPSVKLSQVLATLCNRPLKLPGGFDLDLPFSSVLIQERQGSLTFQLLAGVAGLGVLAFEAQKVAGGAWGFAFGVELLAGPPSRVPGLAALAALEKMLHLSKLLLVVSSIDQPGFQLPDVAAFNRPQLATGKLALPPQAGGVTAGINLFAEWSLDAADRKQSLLKQLLGLDGALQVAIQVAENPASGTRLYLNRTGKLHGHPFQYQLGVEIEDGVPGLFLTGRVTVEIQKHPQTFDLTTAFVPGGAFLSATMTGATAIDCGPFRLSNLALQVGVDWAGIPSLGVAATIDAKGISSSVAVFFDSTDPARSLVAGSINDVTALDVVRAFAGAAKTPLDDLLATIAVHGTHQFTIAPDVADSLDGLVLDRVAAAFAAARVTIPASSQQVTIVPRTRGASWHLTDLTSMRHYQLEKKGDRIQVEIAPQFYFAPQATSIGTLHFPPAYYLNAAISFAGFSAAATIDIAPGKGFSIDAQMDKVTILDEHLFSIAALAGGGGPRLSVSTFAQPDNPAPKLRLPHFYLNGSLTLLGIKQGIFASVSAQGIDFELVGELSPGAHFEVDARFGKGGIGASGKVKVGVGTIDLGKLGKARIDTQLEVALDLDLDTEKVHDANIEKGKTFQPGATVLENERARLVFQGDGNLVLYQSTGQFVWNTATAGRGANRLAFQADGNLVIYNAQGPIWASNTCAPEVTRLALQADGNVVIYDHAGKPRWASNSSGDWARTGAHIELESSFQLAGEHVHIARFKLDVTADTFTRLPKIMEKKAEEALGGVFKDMNKWANAVKGGVMEGVDDTARVFKDVYGKSEHEAKELAGAMGKGANQAAHVVEGGFKQGERAAKGVIKKMKFW